MDKSKQNIYCSLIGNVFEHYDKALYPCLAPVFANIFFQDGNYLKNLILSYLILITGSIAKPLSSLFFGKIGDIKGRKTVMLISLYGTCLISFLYLFLPTYSQAGIFSTLLLITLRLFHDFFSAGETVGACLIILESCPAKKQGFFNALFETSTIVGYMLAFGATALLSYYEWIKTWWKGLYLIGSLFGLLTIFLRTKIQYPQSFSKAKRCTLSILRAHRWSIFFVVFSTGVSYASFYMVTSFFASYLPIVSNISASMVLGSNFLILAFDLILTLLCGYMTLFFSNTKIFYFFSVLNILLLWPIYSSLAFCNLKNVAAAQITLVILGVGFSASLNPLYCSLIPKEYRFTILAFAKAIGSQILGVTSCSIGLYLYNQTNYVGAPSFYLMGITVISIVSFMTAQSKSRTTDTAMHDNLNQLIK